MEIKCVHYGEECVLSYTDEGENTLTQVVTAMSEKGIEFELLPVGDWQDEMFIDVLKYASQKDGQPVYCIVCGAECCYIQTRKLPEDMDIQKLVYDVLGQKKGYKPMVMQSKFGKVLTETMNQANEIIASGNFSEAEQEVIALFREKASSTMVPEDDQWSFEDEDDPVEDETMFLYSYKIVADLLSRKGYSYEKMEQYAKIDHHDVETWENDLKRLYNGFYWMNVKKQ